MSDIAHFVPIFLIFESKHFAANVVKLICFNHCSTLFCQWLLGLAIAYHFIVLCKQGDANAFEGISEEVVVESAVSRLKEALCNFCLECAADSDLCVKSIQIS